jgi:hypothetical protein
MNWFADVIAMLAKPRKADCSFCSRDYLAAGPFVEGPGSVFICLTCCQAMAEVNDANALGRCSFCRKDSSQVGKLVASHDGVCICRDCVDFASEIFRLEAERRAAKTQRR